MLRARIDGARQGRHRSGAPLAQQAADEGENRAYMVLGDAYNPAMLTRLGVLGAPGDAALARDYYNRAVAAGLTGARDRLASLETAN